MRMILIRIAAGPRGVIYLQRHLFTTCFGAGSVSLNTNLNENASHSHFGAPILTPAVPPIVTGGIVGVRSNS